MVLGVDGVEREGHDEVGLGMFPVRLVVVVSWHGWLCLEKWNGMRITKRKIARVIIACWLATVVATVASAGEQNYLAWLSNLGNTMLPPLSHAPSSWEYFRNTLIMASVIILPPSLLASLLAFAIYRIIPDSKAGTECRCRRCGYILRGLSKPECSECGEVI